MPDEDRFEDEKKFARLKAEKSEISAREKEINAELETLQAKLLERWELEGIRGTPDLVSEGVKLGMRKEGWVKVKREGDEPTSAEKAAALKALKAYNPDYITEGYNSRSVSSLAKEEHWDQAIPEGLEDHFTFEPEYKIVAYKLKSKKADEPETLASTN